MEETGEADVGSDVSMGMGGASLEDSLEEEMPNCALRRAHNSEEQQQGPISCSQVQVHTTDGSVCRAQTLHQFPTCSGFRAHTVICGAGHPGTLIFTVTNAIKGTIWRSELRKTHLQTLPQRLDGAVTM